LPAEGLIKAAVQDIRNRSLPEGGFAMSNGEAFRPDATAWAVIALKACFGSRDLTTAACRRLAASQLSDGRVSVIADHPEAYWPTALAIMAWKNVAGFEREVEKALHFLLATAGRHWPKQKNADVAHDTSIRGWPWIENTHSWIDPTSLSILALKAGGYSSHQRVLEAKEMVLDRQIPSGGWNYGNTRVFGTMLRPDVVSTGHALSALAGLTVPRDVELSLDYLRREISQLKTPLALSWAIFGLTAWSYRPSEIRTMILDSLARQKRYGIYDTTLLAQLVVAYFTSGDLLSLFYN
jgi:hypothetical protein